MPESTQHTPSSAARRPLVITVAGVLLLVGPFGWRAWGFASPLEWALGGGAALLYAAWLAWESRVSVRELGRDEPRLDGGSMEAAAAAKLALLLCALLGGGTISLRPALAGLGLLAVGVALRAAGIRALGDEYSHRIRVPRRVVATGPYRWLRHPAYVGTLAAHAGVVLVFLNPASLAAWTLLWLPVVLWRCLREERQLAARSPEYAAWLSGTGPPTAPGPEPGSKPGAEPGAGPDVQAGADAGPGQSGPGASTTTL